MLMNHPMRSSLPPSNPTPPGGATTRPDEGPPSSPFPDGIGCSPPWERSIDPRFVVKRLFDLSGALVGLALLAPLMLMIALGIRLDSPGPVLVRQVRRGYRGRPFRMFRFRTTAGGAEPPLQDDKSAGGVLFPRCNDQCVTRLGRFVRHHGLDGLPQLINVLKGEMSVIGPHPLSLRASDRLQASDPQAYMTRLRVPPGLTGPAQAARRRDPVDPRMIQLDLDYVENWSLGRDLWLIVESLFVAPFRRRAN
jgi:lipopolysaccharide/colanic/teichoic acid biosynthesis glycosyltransferase